MLEEKKAAEVIEENNLETSENQDKTAEESEITNESENLRLFVQKPLSISKVLGFAVLVAGLVVSILVNISVLSIGEARVSATSPFQWLVIGGALSKAKVTN